MNKTTKYLLFKVNNQVFGIDIYNVNQVVECEQITPMPKTKPEVIGMTNILGEVNIVVDLQKCLFKNESAKKDSNNRQLLLTLPNKKCFTIDELLKIVDIDNEEITKLNNNFNKSLFGKSEDDILFNILVPDEVLAQLN